MAGGQVVCLIDTEGAPKEGQSTPSPTEAPARCIRLLQSLTKVCCRLSACRKKIVPKKDLESIVGTGRNGRITKEDAVRQYLLWEQLLLAVKEGKNERNSPCCGESGRKTGCSQK